MKILAIDPSSTAMGYAVLDETEELSTFGVIFTKKSSYEKRYTTLVDALEQVRLKHLPDQVACERAIRFKGRRVPALEVAVQCVKEWAQRNRLPVVFYSPGEWKRSVVGDGSADKEAVARVIYLQYGMFLEDSEKFPDPSHITDAIGIGLHHLGMLRMMRLADAGQT